MLGGLTVMGSEENNSSDNEFYGKSRDAIDNDVVRSIKVVVCQLVQGRWEMST